MDRLTPSAQAARASVGGVAAEVLDGQGRLIITPNALTREGQRNIPADLQPGESLAAFLARHVPGVLGDHPGAVMVTINGAQVPQAMWPRVYPHHGTIITVRTAPQRQALQIVAVAALAYFTMGAGAAWVGTTFGVGAGAASAIGMGLFVSGSMLINKVLAPKLPTASAQPRDDVHTLAPANNSARPNQPMPLLLGVMRYAPDYASLPYTWYEGNEQYAAAIFCAGLNVDRLDGSLYNGDTALDNYEGVEVYTRGFASMAQQDIPLHTNVDTTDGAALDVPKGNAYANGALWDVYGEWVQRRSSADTLELQIDLEGQLYDVAPKGGVGTNAVRIQIEYCPVGSNTWRRHPIVRLEHAKTSPLRRTITIGVTRGQYDVRVRCSTAGWQDTGDVANINFTQLRSVKADPASYIGQARIAVRMQATGQLNGHLSEITGTFVARAMPYWDGNAWVQASVDNGGLSNPGAQILLLLRGIYANDASAPAGKRLVAGCGYPDSMIDIEGLKAFMAHCKAHNLTHDAIIRDGRSNRELCEQIALCGLGAFGYYGGKWGVQYAWADQPLSGTASMGNIVAGTFGLDIDLHRAADGIVYTYYDRAQRAERQIEVYAPGAQVMLNPARITGEGVTRAEHAAILARYHLGQSLYQSVSTQFEQTAEALDYTRMAVLAISHDLTQWGHSGRLVAVRRNAAGAVELELDEPVPAHGSPFIGLRLPGERVYRVMALAAVADGARTVRLANDWPDDVPLPGSGADNPAHDTTWLYDFKATPGARMRVTSVQYQQDLQSVTVSAVPESPEFWDYVLHGSYQRPHNDSLLQHDATPVASNLRVAEQQIVQGNTVYTELTVTFDVTGQMERAEVWAAPEGQEPQFVAETRTRQAIWRIGIAGNWLVQVRPFSASRAGPVASLLYATQAVDAPPWNYDTLQITEIAGGLRRYSFAYTESDPPIDLAGAEIRYQAGTHAAPDWEAMQPLGGSDGLYTAAFESALPPEGSWTFALRARNTSGQLSNAMLVRSVQLGPNFEQVQTKDPTPPPAPTGFAVSAALTSATLQTDRPSYSQGHGHGITNFYVAEVTAAQPTPTLAQARLALASPEHIGTAAVELGKTYRWWVSWQTVDGAEGPAAGPLTLTVGKVGNADLGDLIVEARHIANGSIDAAKLAEQAVDATKFATGIEPVGIISGNTLPTTKSTSTIVMGGKLYRWSGSSYTAAVPTADLTGSITSAQIANNAITVGKIAAGAVTAAKLASGAVGSDHLADLAVTAAKVADNAVTVGKIANGAVSAAKLAQGAVDATKFAAGIEPVGVISGSTLPTTKSTSTIVMGGKLYRWSGSSYTAAVPAADLAGQITATQISDGAISAPKIAANAITAVKLAANAVTADKIAVNSITAAKIAAGAINAEQIAAGAITASKLTLSDTTNLIYNGDLSNDADGWDLSGNVQRVWAPANMPCQFALEFRVPTGSRLAVTWQKRLPCSADASYRFSMLVRASGDWPRKFSARMRIEFFDGSDSSLGIHWIQATHTATVPSEYARTSVPPAGSAYFRLQVFREADVEGEVHLGYIGMIAVRQMASAAFIVNGAVTADKIAAQAVTADKVAANAISANAIAAGSITTAKIEAGAVTATELAAGSVTAAKIVAGTITAAQMAANSITSAKIAADAVTTSKIAAGAVTATEIAANAITAIKLAANAVTSDKIAANAITAAKIAAGAINAEQIAANAITASKLNIRDIESLVANGEMQDGQDGWQTTNWYGIEPVENGMDNRTHCLRVKERQSAGNAYIRNSKKFSCHPGETFYVEFAARTVNYSGGLHVGRFRFDDGAGGNRGNPSINAAPVSHGKWTRVSGVVTAPAGAVEGYVEMRQAGGTTGAVAIAYLRVYRRANAALIVDGAITADKLAAKAIAVGTAAIENGAITNAMIGSLSADKISAGTLSAARIASGSIDASKLAASAITAEKIAANAITTTKLRANAVTAEKINVNALSAISANIGTITAGLLRNSSNNTFINLNATGSTRAIQFGDDLTYSQSEGLVINKVNVIDTLQVKGQAITQVAHANRGEFNLQNQGGNGSPGPYIQMLSVPIHVQPGQNWPIVVLVNFNHVGWGDNNTISLGIRRLRRDGSEIDFHQGPSFSVVRDWTYSASFATGIVSWDDTGGIGIYIAQSWGGRVIIPRTDVLVMGMKR